VVRSIRRKASKPSRATTAAVEGFDEELDTIVGEGLPGSMPDTLYHYTSWQGFKGIVSSQRMRATAHHSTKDPAELTTADALIVEVATDLARNAAPRVRPLLGRFLAQFQDRKISRAVKAYLSCFSVEGDKPSQWSAFADRGHGVCLAFRVIQKERLTTELKPATLPVIYAEAALRASVEAKFRRVLDAFDAFARRYRDGFEAGEQMAWVALMRVAGMAGISAKRPECEAEAEWRTVVLKWPENVEPQPQFRPDGGEYIDIRLRDEPRRFDFVEIVLGPGNLAHESEAIAEAHAVLVAAGYGTADERMPPIRVSRAVLPEEEPRRVQP
jgi:hypothetical protein